MHLFGWQKALPTLPGCRVEASLANASLEHRYQFERTGYFCLDSVDAVDGKLVFNRTVTLRDSWEKD